MGFLRGFLGRRLTTLGLASFALGAAFIFSWLLVAAASPHLGVSHADDLASKQFAVDFRDYWLAAGRMAGHASPYNPAMLFGPIGSQGFDVYRYPPILAFLLIPLSGLDYVSAGWIWVGLSVPALIVGMVISLQAGGTRLSPQVLIWTGAATVWFLPTLDSLWKGNVESLQVLLIALVLAGGAGARGGSIVAGAWRKVPPVLLVPALLVRDGRRGVAWLFGASAILVVPALIWAPDGFRQLPQILINISGADSVVATNLAPSSWLTTLTGSSIVGEVARVAAIIAAFALVGLSIYLARRPQGWAAAMLVGGSASLLLPGTIWEHYLLVLLPFGVYVWPRLSFEDKVWLTLAGAVVSGGGFISSFAFLGAVAFVAIALKGLWPPAEQAEISTGGRLVIGQVESGAAQDTLGL